MEELIRLYLDGVLVTPPVQIEEGVFVVLERDLELSGLVKTFTEEIRLIGTAYDALWAAFTANSIFDTVDVRIDRRDGNGNYSTVFTGIIYVNDVQFDLTRTVATTAIQDSTYYGLIDQNKRIKARLDGVRSKNDQGLTAPSFVNIDFFNPSDALATYAYADRDCIQVDDALDYLIKFMTDSAISYTSNYFGSGGDGEGLFIATGSAIRNDTDPEVRTSFFDLFTNLSKLKNLSFAINDPLGSPQLQIEPTEDLFTRRIALTLSNINGLTLSFDKDGFYSLIQVGSETTQDDEAGTFSFPDGRFYGHKEEEYHVLGNSNIDRPLDLVNDYIIDSNVFEDVLVTPSDSYDENVFLVETDHPTNDRATKFDTFTPGAAPYVYNIGLNNESKCNAWVGGIPNGVAEFGDGVSNLFEADKGGLQTLAAGSNVIIFSSETSDPGGNYDHTTGYYAAPADGSYSFYVTLPPIVVNQPAATTDYFIEHYAAGDTPGVSTPINSVQFGAIIFPDDYDDGTLLDEYAVSQTFYMDSTDFVCVRVATTGGSTGVSTGTFLSAGNSVDGGIYQDYDPSAYRGILLDFRTPLTEAQFNTIFSNQTKRIKVTHFGTSYHGWINRIQWNIITGMAEVQLRSSFNVLL